MEKHLTACNAIAGELDPSEGEAVRGDNPGKESGTVVVHSILPPALAEQVKAAADQERRSVSSLIRNILQDQMPVER